MNHAANNQLRLANDRIASFVREADDDRRARVAAVRPAVEARPSIRRSVGHRIIRFGERLAAEPHVQPARSR